MQLFECTICTFSHQVLDRRVQSVKFVTLHDGEVVVMHGHESTTFFLCPGKITVQMREPHAKDNKHAYDIYSKSAEGVRTFCNGYGYVKIEDGKLYIFAFPIFMESELSKEVEEQMKNFGGYGTNCWIAWKDSK